jgi:GAF domain-containing protein
LQRVSDYAQTLQATLELGAILQTALAESRAIVPIERMTIALAEGEKLRNVSLFANGEIYHTLENGTEVDLDESLVGRVWRDQTALHVPDAAAVDRTGDQLELRSLLIAPLRAGSSHLGVVSVGHSQPYIYTETDVIVFQQMVGQLAAAIENALVYERSRRQVRNEALVNEIAIRLQQQVDLEQMATVAAQDLGKALGARQVRIRLGTNFSAGEGAG